MSSLQLLHSMFVQNQLYANNLGSNGKSYLSGRVMTSSTMVPGAGLANIFLSAKNILVLIFLVTTMKVNLGMLPS